MAFHRKTTILIYQSPFGINVIKVWIKSFYFGFLRYSQQRKELCCFKWPYSLHIVSILLLLLYSIIITLCDNLFSKKKNLLSWPGLKLSGRIFFTGRMFFFLYFGKFLFFLKSKRRGPRIKLRLLKRKGISSGPEGRRNWSPSSLLTGGFFLC